MAKILVLGDDTSADFETLAFMMELGGHRCTPVKLFEEAVKLLQEGIFDLVVVVQGAQIGRSLDRLKELKKKAPGVPVMVITEAGALAPTVGSEVKDLLPPPFTHEDLYERLNNLLQRSSGRHRQRQGIAPMRAWRNSRSLAS